MTTLEIALSGATELRARSIGRNINTVPITPAELEAAHNVKPGGDASAIDKLFRHLEGQRRLVGHVFWVHGTPAWWLFFFDNREADPMDNHWVGGAHMHMVSWLTHSRVPIETFLKELVSSPSPDLPHKVHIKLEA